MRIVLVLTALDAGGVGAVTRILAEQLQVGGHEVTMVALTRSKRVFDVKVPVVTFPFSSAGLGAFIGAFVALVAYFAARREIEAVVVASDYPALITLMALKLTWHKAVVVVNSHNTISVYARTQSRFKQMLLGLNRWIYRWADAVANVSAGAAEDSRRFFRLDKVETLYNPVCSSVMLNYVPPRAPHAWLADQARSCLVACGWLAMQKNYSLMLEVFAGVLAVKPEVRLLILGEGPLLGELQTQVKTLGIGHAVVFVGQVGNALDYFYYARGLWLTSVYEGLPTVLIEALAMGTPAVAVNCPHGPDEILQGQTYGVLVPTYEMAENVKAMLAFLESPRRDRSVYRRRAADFMIEPRTQAYVDLLKNRQEVRG